MSLAEGKRICCRLFSPRDFFCIVIFEPTYKTECLFRSPYNWTLVAADSGSRVTNTGLSLTSVPVCGGTVSSLVCLSTGKTLLCFVFLVISLPVANINALIIRKRSGATFFIIVTQKMVQEQLNVQFGFILS